MQILLADSKTMQTECRRSPVTKPRFSSVADAFAREMGSLTSSEVNRLLGGSSKVVSETQGRYRDFFVTEKIPALLAFTGQAYKHLQASTLSEEALSYADEHLFITSFLYGLLRPMDGISPYRMEQSVRLKATNEVPVNQFWREKLTGPLIEEVSADDGILLQLSTEEYEKLFHRNEVKGAVRVVKPWFYVRKDGALKIQAVWAKSCRGAMVRYILERRVKKVKELKEFNYEGFHYAGDEYGDQDNLYFIREETP